MPTSTLWVCSDRPHYQPDRAADSARVRYVSSEAAPRVDLWFAYDQRVRDTALLARYHTLLSAPEQAQRRRFVFARHRHQYLITRALVRTVLSYYHPSVMPQDWVFVPNEYGKPSAHAPQGPRAPHFNLSHSDELVVMAVCQGYEVGVDVEWLVRKGETVSLADRFFSPIESEQLRALAAPAQQSRFFDLWTLKESYIKACGMGLSIPLDEFTFEFPGERGLSIQFAPQRQDNPHQWRFWQWQPGREHKVALAVRALPVDAPCQVQMREVVPLGDDKPVDYLCLRSSMP